MDVNKMMKNKKKHRIRLLAGISILLLGCLIGCAIYLNDYYHTDMACVEVFTSGKSIHWQTCENGNLIFEPENATSGLIFYPGGKVEYTAYIPLMNELASDGILCVLVEMPFNLAVLDMNAADGILEKYPQIEDWYMGGHSLGGSMAASYLSEHANDYEGLILLGSYSTADLSETKLEVLSIYGSEDGVLKLENYSENAAHLPEDFREVILDGGCHAYFGMYGEQDGDGVAFMTNEEQIRKTGEVILEFIKP